MATDYEDYLNDFGYSDAPASGGSGFNAGGLVGLFSNLAGTAVQTYSGLNPPKSKVNTAARVTAAKDYTPWIIGGGLVVLLLVFVGLLRK